MASAAKKKFRGISLVETIVVVAVAAMVMTAVLRIYNQVRTTAVSINQALDEDIMATEILQRIAEDLDRLAAPGLDTRININNKFSHGYNISRLVIENRIFDKRDSPVIFEKVIWQTYYDTFEEAVILYRSHRGINLEEKLLDADKEKIQRQMFIPLCTGITFFKIQVLRNEDFLDQWSSSKLPKSVVATISFGEPFKTISGELDVADEEKTSRTIAIDRTRKIKYIFVEKLFTFDDANEPMDPNLITDPNMIDANDLSGR